MSVTVYNPNYVVKETLSDGQIQVSFLSKHHGLNENTASHEVEGYKVFVKALHDKKYIAAHHLKSEVNATGFYHYRQTFKKKA